MGTRTSYEPGLFSWVDLATSDVDAAGRFYESILGWEIRDDGGYRLFSLPGGDVAGAFPVEDGPPRWNTYITVDSADDAVEQATKLGATVIQEPVDAHTAGRLAGLADPAGAAFLVWEPRERFGAEYVNDPGAWTWSELMTREPDAAVDFYGRLFGWDYEEPEEANGYRVIRHGGRQVGGILPMPDELPPDAPPGWGVYFNLTDLDGTLAQVKEAGGIVLTDVMEIPGVGRFCPCADPQGASFILIQGERWDD